MRHCKLPFKLLLLVPLLMVFVSGYGQYSSVSYYVVAHQNQWQLFMGLNAYNDITSGGKKGADRKVVMIYTTAGDESCDGGQINIPYYLARQSGADHCIEFCADQFGQHSAWTTSTENISGHNILRTQYKNVIGYCMRLPGGCADKGFRQQCLAYFKDGQIPMINAVDSSAEYQGWGDLVSTVAAIIDKERNGIAEVILNTADTDRTLNAGDHPDHMCSARLGLDAIANAPDVTVNLFREYAVAKLPANLPGKDIATKAALLSLLDYGRTEHGQPSEWSPVEVSYTARSYFRTVKK